MIRLGNAAPGGIELKEVEPAVQGTVRFRFIHTHIIGHIRTQFNL